MCLLTPQGIFTICMYIKSSYCVRCVLYFYLSIISQNLGWGDNKIPSEINHIFQHILVLYKKPLQAFILRKKKKTK